MCVVVLLLLSGNYRECKQQQLPHHTNTPQLGLLLMLGTMMMLCWGPAWRERSEPGSVPEHGCHSPFGRMLSRIVACATGIVVIVFAYHGYHHCLTWAAAAATCLSIVLRVYESVLIEVPQRNQDLGFSAIFILFCTDYKHAITHQWYEIIAIKSIKWHCVGGGNTSVCGLVKIFFSGKIRQWIEKVDFIIFRGFTRNS